MTTSALIENVAPAPVTADFVEPPVPVIEHVMPAPVVNYSAPSATTAAPPDVEPAPVIGYIAPAPPVTFSTPNQQFPAYTMAAVTTGVSVDTTGFVNPPCPITVVEAPASRVVSSLPPLGEFTAPVHQEQIVAEQERVQQHTAEQTVHVPIPPTLEHLEEGVKEIPQETFPEQTAEQIRFGRGSGCDVALTCRCSCSAYSCERIRGTCTRCRLTPDISKRAVEQVVDGPEDDEQMLLGYQANIDQCVHILKTKKEMIERYEKQVAALLERVPRAVFSRDRRVLQKLVDEWTSICRSWLKTCSITRCRSEVDSVRDGECVTHDLRDCA